MHRVQLEHLRQIARVLRWLADPERQRGERQRGDAPGAQRVLARPVMLAASRERYLGDERRGGFLGQVEEARHVLPDLHRPVLRGAHDEAVPAGHHLCKQPVDVSFAIGHVDEPPGFTHQHLRMRHAAAPAQRFPLRVPPCLLAAPLARHLLLVAHDALDAEEPERYPRPVGSDGQRHVRQESLVLRVDRAEPRTACLAAERAVRRVVDRVGDVGCLHTRDRPLHVRVEERLKADALVGQMAVQGLQHGPIAPSPRASWPVAARRADRRSSSPACSAADRPARPRRTPRKRLPAAAGPAWSSMRGRSRSAAVVYLCGIISPATRGPGALRPSHGSGLARRPAGAASPRCFRIATDVAPRRAARWIRPCAGAFARAAGPGSPT